MSYLDDRPETSLSRCDGSDYSKIQSLSDETKPLLFSASSTNSQKDVENDFFGSYLEDPKRNLGTFSGVFVPVSLSIFGALLFLRIGFLVGNGGLVEVLFLLVIAYAILLLTVSSICAICTNGAVQGGGVYCYIADGALPAGKWWSYLYGSCVNLVNCVVCIIGASMFAKTSLLIFIIISTCISSVLVSIWTQNYVIQVDIPFSNPVSLKNATANYTGLKLQTFQENLWPSYSVDYLSEGKEVNFAVVFGVLFSGVTGIMAGANLSGDLKDPGMSIPKGTLAGLSFTFSIYTLLSIFSAGSCERFLLQNNYIYLLGINLWPGFITIGAIMGTFSSSLSCLIGASRILEALSRDEIFGILLKPISAFKTSNGNPIFAVLTAWIIVQLISLIGSLNVIALMTSVLFLLSYLAINFACMCLDLSSAPNFRPNFKYFSWHTALLGLLGSCVMMFIISSLYAAVSIMLCLLLIIGIHFRSPPSDWGSISQALIFHQVRKYLLLLDPRKDHVKFWRPQMLLMISELTESESLINFVNDLKKSGLFVLGHVKLGSVESLDDGDPLASDYPKWISVIDHLKVKAFVELTIANSVREGLHHLIRISGLGAMKPNTIIFGFPNINRHSMKITSGRDAGDFLEYVQMLSDVLSLRKNVCVCRNFENYDKSTFLRNKGLLYIDIYPLDIFQPESVNNLDNATLFLLQLACVLHMVNSWKKKTILRVFLCLRADDADSENKMHQLSIKLKLLRINALVKLTYIDDAVEVLDRHLNGDGDARTIFDNHPYFRRINAMIRKHGENTAVVFLKLPVPPGGCKEAVVAEKYVSMLSLLSDGLPPTVLVHGVHSVVTTTL